MDNNLFERTDEYINDMFAVEDDVLKSTITSLDEAGIENMSVSANQGKFLQLLAKMCNAKNILELGTLGGYSTIWLARALPENGKLITLEFDKKHAEVAAKNIEKAGLQHKVDIRIGKAIDILDELENENSVPFDLIFIDADKPPYTEYFQKCLRLSRCGTIIVADNVIRNGKVLDVNSPDEKVQGVQRFNKWLSTCTEVTATILQTVGMKEYDGMAIAVVN